MDSKDLKDLLLSGQLTRPVVFDDMISSWPLFGWDVSNLADFLGEKTIKFRIGKKQCKDVQWETQCVHENATVLQFLEWLEGAATSDNPLSAYDSDNYWCYADYKYMMYMFADQPEFLKAVDWSVFGFMGRDGSQSTLWLGSKGAHTPCHYDTYGCNLVAQIHGRKRWFLFPPDQVSCMYPTRIPYEESSVFSQVNVTSPDLGKHPRFKLTRPYVVTLEPGQVLYVPHHWWHYVESLTTSLSINSWVELPSDYETRLQEAVTRTLVTTLMAEDTSLPVDAWLNPTEDPFPFEMSMKCVKQSLGMLETAAYSPPVSSASPSDAACSSAVVDTINETNNMGGMNLHADRSKTISGKDTDLPVKSDSDLVSHNLPENYEPESKKTRLKNSSEEKQIHACSGSEALDNLSNVTKVQSLSFDDYSELIYGRVMRQESVPEEDGESHDGRDDKGAEGVEHINVWDKISYFKADVTEDSGGTTSRSVSSDNLITDTTSGTCEENADKEAAQIQVKEVQIDTATFVNCVVHPQVVSQICQLLKENVKL